MALASDLERESATIALRRHYANGRLTLEDLNERLQQALSARSQRELASTLRELPPLWRDRDELQRLGQVATARGQRLVKRAVFLGTLAAGWLTLNLLLLVAFIAIVAVHGATALAVGLLPLAWLATSLLALHIARRG